MKSVLLSIKPKYCELIAKGKKTIEVRKSMPKLDTPFKCYIYMTKTNLVGDRKVYKDRMAGKVIGEFVCDKIDKIVHAGTSNDNLQLCIVENDWTYTPLSNEYLFYETQLTYDELDKYSNGGDLYGWHISNLIIYDEPKKLSEFKKYNRNCWYAHLGLAKRDCPECQNKECFLRHPPQSYCYVEGIYA